MEQLFLNIYQQEILLNLQSLNKTQITYSNQKKVLKTTMNMVIKGNLI